MRERDGRQPFELRAGTDSCALWMHIFSLALPSVSVESVNPMLIKLQVSSWLKERLKEGCDVGRRLGLGESKAA